MRFDDAGDIGTTSSGIGNVIDFYRYTMENPIDYNICPYWSRKQDKHTRIGRGNYTLYVDNTTETNV